MRNRSHIQIVLLLIGCCLYATSSMAQRITLEYRINGTQPHDDKIQRLLQPELPSKEDLSTYLVELRKQLISDGYIAASIDSLREKDTTNTIIWLFPGERYNQIINTDSLPDRVKQFLRISGQQSNIRPSELTTLKRQILDFYENSGYPFARISEENQLSSDTLTTRLMVDKGVLYHIDSIRILGKAKLNSSFLQNYLGIKNNSIYNKQTLSKVDRLIENLPYVTQTQASDLMMLGTGATLNLYLEPKRSSEINALIGFLPANTITGKAKVTADVRLNLKNALAGGETIFINWQQIKAKTPRLDLAYSQPYMLGTPYGIDFSFGMLKQDSSYLKLTTKLGIRYSWSPDKYLNVYYGINSTRLMQGGIDTQRILTTHLLPENLDVSAGSGGGINYHFQNLDYELNPRKGLDIDINISGGIRKVKLNSNITDLKDKDQPDFDFKKLYDTVRLRSQILTVQLNINHYTYLGKNSVLKLSGKGGMISSPQLFRNELYRIGGYKLLRGFDEESIFADRYGVATGEYRMLTGENSFLFGFVDFGVTHSRITGTHLAQSFISTGLGLELETGFGLLNVSYAIGKRNDLKFDIRNASKIHFGYINYF